MIPLPIHYSEVEDVFGKTLGQGMTSLAVTASQDQEGSSILAYALARRAAASGRKTLLVDFNRRTPTVGLRLGLPKTNWCPTDPNSLQAVTPLSKTGLSVLTAPEAETDWLQAREVGTLKRFIATLLQDYDCLVADTSPLTARNQENFPPENVSAACQAALLVVLTGRTPEAQVIEALARLKSTNCNLVGTILNDRYAPTLTDELNRETRRLDRLLPKLASWLRRRIEHSVLLNQSI